MIEVRRYTDLAGRIAFDRWFDKLDDTTQARIVVALDGLERGNVSAIKGVGASVFELRMDFGPGYRIYFGKDGETGGIVPLTRSFNETIKARLTTSGTFRRALLREAVDCMIAGDLETGKSVLRKYINGTIGFIQLGHDLDRSPKVLMRMLGPSGNPQARGLFDLVAHLQKLEGTVLSVVEKKAA